MMHPRPFAILAATIVLIFANSARSQTQTSVGLPHGALRTPALLVSYQQTKEVVFGPFRNYDHKSGWFSVAMPGNWNINDKSDQTEVIVSLVDPTENAVVVVRVYQPNRGYTSSELGEMLKAFLKERMGSFDGFSMAELKPQRAGVLGFQFKYNSMVEGTNYKMYGDTFIEQYNGRIGLVTMVIPQDQYEAKQKSANELMNSFRLTGKAP
jgi:hypothetical protein